METISLIDMSDDDDVESVNEDLEEEASQDRELLEKLIRTSAITLQELEQEATNQDEEENLYLTINAQIDKQIALDTEAINNYLNLDESESYVRRLDFFDKMKDSPIDRQVDAATTNHVLRQYNGIGTVQYHECPKCEFKAKEKTKIQEHILNRHNSVNDTARRKCAKCNYRAPSDIDLKRHTTLMHPSNGKFSCDVCPQVYSNGLDLRKHMKSSHNFGEDYLCERCFYVGEDREDLREHVLRDHITLNVSWYKCPSCSYRTVRKINLDRHIMYKHT